MADIAGPILLVGCGKMGGAMLEGWIAGGLDPKDAFVVEPDSAARERVRDELGAVAVAEPKALPEDLAPRAIVFAVKPQAMAATLPAFEPVVARGGVVLSIAAGTSVARFAAAFGDDTAVVRAMPNTPASIGKGVSALFANAAAAEEQRALCFTLMRAVGDAIWIDDEEQMHAITAMSGGGPAYLFLLVECLVRAGVASGLPEEMAARLARATVTGSAALAATSDLPVETLRRNVTSPGGTTEAALAVLMDDERGMRPLFERAIAAGTRRSRELA